MDLLLSIKPNFAKAIFSEEKKFEFRRVIFRDGTIRKAYVYASKPVGLVVGEFEIEEVITETPDSLWGITCHFSGISKEDFDNYFKGKEIAHAIKVGKVQEYAAPVELAEIFGITCPPQSFRYVRGKYYQRHYGS